MFAQFEACSEFVKTKIIIAAKTMENILDTNNNAEDLSTVGDRFLD
jgi:hypothetical protein